MWPWESQVSGGTSMRLTLLSGPEVGDASSGWWREPSPLRMEPVCRSTEEMGTATLPEVTRWRKARDRA